MIIGAIKHKKSVLSLYYSGNIKINLLNQGLFLNDRFVWKFKFGILNDHTST